MSYSRSWIAVLLALLLAVLPANAASPGTVVAWGSNGSGEATVPVGLSGVVAIAAGGAHTLALKSDGTVVAWEQTTVVKRLFQEA